MQTAQFTHKFATQLSHFVDRAGWQAEKASVGYHAGIGRQEAPGQADPGQLRYLSQVGLGLTQYTAPNYRDRFHLMS